MWLGRLVLLHVVVVASLVTADNDDHQCDQSRAVQRFLCARSRGFKKKTASALRAVRRKGKDGERRERPGAAAADSALPIQNNQTKTGQEGAPGGPIQNNDDNDDEQAPAASPGPMPEDDAQARLPPRVMMRAVSTAS